MSSPATDPTVPLELVEKIFGEFEPADLDSLKNCALTCNAYLILARKYLFRTVIITFGQSDSHKPSYFLQFLANNPHISSNIQSLVVDADYDGFRTMVDQEQYWRMATNEFVKVAKNIVGLRRLVVYHNDSTVKVKSVIDELLRLPTLRQVELRGWEMSHNELLALGSIPEVLLSRVTVIRSPSPPSECPRDLENASRVRKISLSQLTVITREDAVLAQANFALARAAGATLERLKWISIWHHATDAYLYFIDLKSLPHLRFLSVSTPLEEEQFNRLRRIMVDCSNAKCKLEILEILCDYDSLPDEQTIAGLGWEQLDEVLVRAAQYSLRKVIISVKAFQYPPNYVFNTRERTIYTQEAFSMFERRLPKLRGKGMIYPA